MRDAPEIVTTVPLLAVRPRDGHKGTFGRVLVIAGSRGMAGAAVLAASAALRAGAGLVRLAIVSSQATVAASHNPCYTVAPLPEDARGQISRDALPVLKKLAQDNDAIALGPGLGQGAGVAATVQRLVETLSHPMIVDADALNALAVRNFDLSRVPPRILTPHPGEMARLTGSMTKDVQAARETMAIEYAQKKAAIVVLKGSQTLVTDGRRLYRNTTGNPGMGTGGTGDVLTGVIAALVGQGLSPFEAAQLGVFVHGRAGDLAANDRGEAGLIASDLLHHLPDALRTASSASGPGMSRP